MIKEVKQNWASMRSLMERMDKHYTKEQASLHEYKMINEDYKANRGSDKLFVNAEKGNKFQSYLSTKMKLVDGEKGQKTLIIGITGLVGRDCYVVSEKFPGWEAVPSLDKLFSDIDDSDGNLKGLNDDKMNGTNFANAVFRVLDVTSLEKESEEGGQANKLGRLAAFRNKLKGKMNESLFEMDLDDDDDEDLSLGGSPIDDDDDEDLSLGGSPIDDDDDDEDLSLGGSLMDDDDDEDLDLGSTPTNSPKKNLLGDDDDDDDDVDLQQLLKKPIGATSKVRQWFAGEFSKVINFIGKNLNKNIGGGVTRYDVNVFPYLSNANYLYLKYKSTPSSGEKLFVREYKNNDLVSQLEQVIRSCDPSVMKAGFDKLLSKIDLMAAAFGHSKTNRNKNLIMLYCQRFGYPMPTFLTTSMEWIRRYNRIPIDGAIPYPYLQNLGGYDNVKNIKAKLKAASLDNVIDVADGGSAVQKAAMAGTNKFITCLRGYDIKQTKIYDETRINPKTNKPLDPYYDLPGLADNVSGVRNKLADEVYDAFVESEKERKGEDEVVDLRTPDGQAKVYNECLAAFSVKEFGERIPSVVLGQNPVGTYIKNVLAISNKLAKNVSSNPATQASVASIFALAIASFTTGFNEIQPHLQNISHSIRAEMDKASSIADLIIKVFDSFVDYVQAKYKSGYAEADENDNIFATMDIGKNAANMAKMRNNPNPQQTTMNENINLSNFLKDMLNAYEQI